jgi:flagellar assembly factor FliW
MKLVTDQFGEVEFEENIIIKFDDGIFGFEELKNFLVINEKEGLFYWLTSVEKPEIVFPLFPVALLNESFETKEDWQPFGIVKLDKHPENITVNLKAPVYINHDIKKGYQKIIDTEKYPVDYPLFVKNED